MDRTENILLGIGVGMLVGFTIALLVTPKSGEETRELIKDKALEVKDKAVELKGRSRAAVSAFKETKVPKE